MRSHIDAGARLLALYPCPRGALQNGDRVAAGCFDRANILLGRRHSATGPHLPSEDTAPPSAVPPFASLLSRIPFRKAAAAPVEICPALP